MNGTSRGKQLIEVSFREMRFSSPAARTEDETHTVVMVLFFAGS